MTDLAQRLKVWYLNGSFLQAAEAEAFTLDATLRHNDVGSWRLVTSMAEGQNWLRFSGGRGDGILLTRDDIPIMVGLLTERLITEEVTAAGGYQTTMTAQGSDALILLQDRWVDPIGGTGGPDYSAAAFDEQTGAAETIIRHYVDVNTGQLARPDRRVTALNLATGDSGSGGTTTVKARFDNLLTLVQRIATLADPLDTGLGFVVTLSETIAGRLEFKVRTPRDLTNQVIFDVSTYTASKATLRETAPFVNAVVVGSDGMLADQTLTEYLDSSLNPFGRRIERYVSAGGTANANDAAKKSREALADGEEIRAFEVEVPDDARYQWGRDFDLGDRVTTVVAGFSGTGIVLEMALKIDGNGVTATPRIGTSARSFQTPVQRRAAQIEDRLSLIERIQAFGTVGMIVGSSRPIAEAPAGWRGCDGSTVNGYTTQNLVDRFPVGAGAGHTLGAAGGSATASLAHTHTMAHTHPYVAGHTGVVAETGGGGNDTLDTTVNLTHGGVDKVARDKHTHTVDAGGTGASSAADTGASSVATINTEPAWRAITWLERCPA